jgi:hypothetical protein
MEGFFSRGKKIGDWKCWDSKGIPRQC